MGMNRWEEGAKGGNGYMGRESVCKVHSASKQREGESRAGGKGGCTEAASEWTKWGPPTHASSRKSA